MSIDLAPAILQQCSDILDAEIFNTRFIGGGDINTARILVTNKGRYFFKMNSGPDTWRVFATEARGLRLLGQSQTIRVPKVLGVGQNGQKAFLILSFVEPAEHIPAAFWEPFGRSLAELHRHSSSAFGLDHDNYIGSLPQCNTPADTWPEFFVNHRLQPLVRKAYDARMLDSSHIKLFESLYARLPRIVPEEPPALIHGDLWSGNFICSLRAEPFLVDPSGCYAHREMDLAMSKLFGGFGPAFYQSYEATYPLLPGSAQRIRIFQIYYLLVHLHLFGTGCLRPIEERLTAFG